MSKDEYNIDNILSEVKKRHEEEAKPKEETPAENAVETTENADSEELTEELTEEEPDVTEEEAAKEPEETSGEPVLIEEAPKEEPSTEPEAEDESEEGMVNLLDYAEEEEAEEAPEGEAPEEEALPEPEGGKTKREKKPKSKTRKILTAVIIVLLILIIAAAAVFVIKANSWLNEIVDDSADQTNVTQTEWQGMSKLVESFDPIKETEGTELSSLEDMVKTWYYNGAPCSSSHVLNVLLIGEDTRGKEILEDETRADAAIIASVNIDTEEIVLTSILRDSWAYWETKPGDESTGEFGKLNGALSTGNLDVYINTVERLYKINIDSYAIVNFTSFEKIIDTLYKDGIELELTAAEINEINNHPGRYGDVTIEKTFEGNSGKIKLTGEQALAYCRIRHIDTDNARADRQKTTLMTIYEDFKDSSTAKKLKFVNQLVPYVKTGFGKSDIIKIATHAFTHGWTSFDISSFNYPAVNVTGGIYGNDFLKQWIWRADFPADAYDLQMRIYGKSSITLAKTRVNTKTVRQKGFYQEGATPTSDTYTNTAYGETTTCMPNDEEEEE